MSANITIVQGGIVQVTITPRLKPVISIFQTAIAGTGGGAIREFTYTATGGETQVTITNLAAATSVFVFIANGTKLLTSTPDAPNSGEYRIIGNTIHFGDSLLSGEAVIIRSTGILST